MRRSKIIIAGIFGAIAASVLAWPRGNIPSVSATFTHYGRHQDLTNEPFGYFVVSNTGTSRVFFQGVFADGSLRQFAQVSSPHGWIDTDPWISTDGTFYLSPGQSREVAVWVEASQAWRVAFRFRKTGFVDRCPRFVWRFLPDRLHHIPDYRKVWTDQVPAYAKQ